MFSVQIMIPCYHKLRPMNNLALPLYYIETKIIAFYTVIKTLLPGTKTFKQLSTANTLKPK